MAFNQRKVASGTAQPVAETAYGIIETHHSQAIGAAAFEPARPTGNPLISGLLVQALGDNIRFTLAGDISASASVGFRLIEDDPPILIPIGPGTTPRFFGEGASASLQYQWTG